MKSYDNYIFDLYGTLVNVRSAIGSPMTLKKLRFWFEGFGAVYTDETFCARFRELKAGQEKMLSLKEGTEYPEHDQQPIFVEMLLDPPAAKPAPFGDPHTWSEDQLKRWAYATSLYRREVSMRRYRVFRETVPTLRALKQAGKHLYLLSNAQASFTRLEVEFAGLDGFFEDILYSSDFGIMKPEPRFIKTVMERNGLDPERTCMTGDNAFSDMGSALSAGCDGFLLNRSGKSPEQIEAELDALFGRGKHDFITVVADGKLSGILPDDWKKK